MDTVNVLAVVPGLCFTEWDSRLGLHNRSQLSVRKSCAEEFRKPESGEEYELEILEKSHGRIKTGKLISPDGEEAPIVNYIPRFVMNEDEADTFGLQWHSFRTTQLDSHTGTTLTRDRFWSGTQWNRLEMEGQRILEAGCGAGRFTEIMLSA